MSEFLKVATLSEIPEGGRLSLEVANRYIVLVHLEGKIFCIDDVCTHDGGPLGEGELIDHCLVCPRHGAKFDVRNGAAMEMPATEPTAAHEVKIEGDNIFVKIA